MNEIYAVVVSAFITLITTLVPYLLYCRYRSRLGEALGPTLHSLHVLCIMIVMLPFLYFADKLLEMNAKLGFWFGVTGVGLILGLLEYLRSRYSKD